MVKLDIEKSSADVVIVVTYHDDRVGGEVFPFWECTMTGWELHEYAAMQCLRMCEENNGGSAQYQIFDGREHI